jgi:hypothetical protein
MIIIVSEILYKYFFDYFLLGNVFNETSNKQSSTSSYISDDCKVLYIETVIEVAKPVFYERTNDSSTTTNTEYHHQIPQSTIKNTEYHHHHIPQSTVKNTEYHHHIPQSTMKNTEYYHEIPQSTLNNSQRSSKNIYMTTKQMHESSDDESHKPVNLTTKSNQIQHMDSGIEYDRTSPPPSSSSSTIFNQRSMNNKLLFPPVTSNPIFDETSQSTLVRRVHSTKTRTLANNNNIQLENRTNSYWNRLQQTWLRSLLLGLLILFILFFVYFSRLDTCSRITMIRTVCRKIIHVEHEGLPTI